MSYPLYNQQQYTPQYPQASCGAVSINIMNPSVGTTNPMAQYVPQYPQGIYQYPQASCYQAQTPVQPYPANYNNNFNTNTMNAMDNNQTPAPPAPAAPIEQAKTEEKKEEKKEELKEKVPLTDDYIKSLENYLNSQDSKVRLMGIKDVLERFKEDPSRKTDAALTALLNKALQDPTAAVRFLALTTLEAGYAAGNDETVQLLTAIQADGQKEYGEDSLLASQILLKMSAGDKVKFKPEPGMEPVDNTAKDEQPKEAA